jgi:hypothetical protein
MCELDSDGCVFVQQLYVCAVVRVQLTLAMRGEQTLESAPQPCSAQQPHGCGRAVYHATTCVPRPGCGALLLAGISNGQATRTVRGGRKVAAVHVILSPGCGVLLCLPWVCHTATASEVRSSEPAHRRSAVRPAWCLCRGVRVVQSAGTGLERIARCCGATAGCWTHCERAGLCGAEAWCGQGVASATRLAVCTVRND